jgi:LysR family hydrogen peroxide-inducible transcriptional activator
MTITQLEYVLAVDEHRNFAAAAKRCYITQPTLSMQIKKLEEELGVLIFDRSKKPVVPTDIGTRIIAVARDGLAQLNEIPDMVRQDREGLSGPLRVGVIPTLSPYLVPLFAGSFAQAHPKVRLQIQEMLTAQIVSALRNDQLDLGLLVTPLGERGIREKPLFYERFQLYLSPEHPLLTQASVDLASLEREELWVLQDGHCFRDQVLRICPGQQLQRTSGASELRGGIQLEAGSLSTLKGLVDRHQGYTMLPELATLGLTAEEQKRLRSFQEPLPYREVSMVVHRRFRRQQLIEAFAEAVLKAVPKSMRKSLNSHEAAVIPYLPAQP